MKKPKRKQRVKTTEICGRCKKRTKIASLIHGFCIKCKEKNDYDLIDKFDESRKKALYEEITTRIKKFKTGAYFDDED